MTSANTFSGATPRLHANVVADDRSGIFTKRDPKAHEASKTHVNATAEAKDTFSTLKKEFKKTTKAAAPAERWQVAKFLWRNKVKVGVSIIVVGSALAATHMLWLAPAMAFLSAHPIGWAIMGAAAGVAAVVSFIYVVRQLKASAKETSTEKLLSIVENRVANGEQADKASIGIVDRLAHPGVTYANHPSRAATGPGAPPEDAGEDHAALNRVPEGSPELQGAPQQHNVEEFAPDASDDSSILSREDSTQTPLINNDRAARNAR